MKTRYIIGFFVMIFVLAAGLSAGYRFTYNRTMEQYFASEEKDQVIAETESIAAEGDAVNDTSGTEKGFCLLDLHGFVAVYLEDRKTIYEFTEIPVDELPASLKQEIREGKYIATEQELYAFLENYSS